MKKISLLLFLIIFSIIGYSGTTLPFNVDTTTHKNIVIKKNLIFRDTSLRHSNSLLSIDSITGKLILINDNLNSSKFINGLTKINDSIYLGGNLLNKTEIFQDTFGLKFINKKDDRYYVINNKPGSICLETTIDTIEQLNGFGKSSFYLDSNSISLNVFDNDFFGYLGERGMVYNQSDTLISIYSMDFIDSHKEINIDRNNIVLSGGMSSGGVYQTVDDRRISFTHWHDNGLGGNDTFTYVFPDTIGQAGQVLTTDGTKFLNWRTPSSGATPAYDSTYQIDDTTFVLFKTLSRESDTIIYRLQFPTLYNANGRIETPRTVYTGSSFFLGAEGANGSYFTLDSATHYSGLYSQVPGYNIHGLFNYALGGKPVISLGISTNSAPDNGIFIEKDTLWSGIKDINSNTNGQYFINKMTSGMSKFGLKKYNQNNFVIDMTSDAPKVSIGNSTTYTPARASFDVQTSDAIIVPVGNTAARPVTPVQGMIRFNTTTNKFEGYDGSTWVDFH